MEESAGEIGKRRQEGNMEEQGVDSETGREEKLLNDETICTLMWLDRASTNGRISSMATGSVTKRKAAISLNTPIFFLSFSLSWPMLFPTTRPGVFFFRCLHKITKIKQCTEQQQKQYELLKSRIIQIHHIYTEAHTCNKIWFLGVQTDTRIFREIRRWLIHTHSYWNEQADKCFPNTLSNHTQFCSTPSWWGQRLSDLLKLHLEMNRLSLHQQSETSK